MVTALIEPVKTTVSWEEVSTCEALCYKRCKRRPTNCEDRLRMRIFTTVAVKRAMFSALHRCLVSLRRTPRSTSMVTSMPLCKAAHHPKSTGTFSRMITKCHSIPPSCNPHQVRKVPIIISTANIRTYRTINFHCSRACPTYQIINSSVAHLACIIKWLALTCSVQIILAPLPVTFTHCIKVVIKLRIATNVRTWLP